MPSPEPDAFADLFTMLPAPSVCQVVATVGDQDVGGFVPDEECRQAHDTFSVEANPTTEIVLFLQCAGPSTGAGDMVAVINHQPAVEAMDFEKFVCAGGQHPISATVTDLDGDAVTCDWSVTGGPPGGLVAPATTVDGSHDVTFSANTPGAYEVTLECDDGLGGATSHTFPMHVMECCGNGLVETDEDCDDGNNEDDDGCSATCEAEACPICSRVFEHQPAFLDCDAGGEIVSVDFASYGTPEGTCGDFSLGFCHADSSLAEVEAECVVGNEGCVIEAVNRVFGDPCPGTFKSLVIELTCSAASPACSD